MDKTTPQLDPKLKEAYDRVMGTVITPTQPSVQAAPPAQPEPIAPVSPAPATEHPVDHPAAPTMVASPSAQPVKANAVKKKGKVSPLIIFLVVIVFLAIYAVVWVKYFGLAIPFLNP